jgi:hypothetical protein
MSAISGKHVVIKKELVKALGEIATLANEVGMATLTRKSASRSWCLASSTTASPPS